MSLEYILYCLNHTNAVLAAVCIWLFGHLHHTVRARSPKLWVQPQPARTDRPDS